MRRRRATVATPCEWQWKTARSGEWAQHFSNASCSNRLSFKRRQADRHTYRQTHSHRCQILTHPYAAITCVGNKSDVGLELDVKEVNGKAGQFTTNYGR